MNKEEIRFLGELCRFTWWGLLKFVPGEDIIEFSQTLVHPMVAHWKICVPTFVLSIAKFDHEAAPFLDDRFELPEIFTTLEAKDQIEKCTGQIEAIDVIRWATVYFWGAQRTLEGFQGVEFRDEWKNSFIEEPTILTLQILDACVVEGICMCGGRPTEQMLMIQKMYSQCQPAERMLN